MAELNVVQETGFPLSLQNLRKSMGRSPLFDHLRMGARRDVVSMFDDFVGDTMDTFWTAVANGGGSGATAFAITVAENGNISATTGTANDDTTTQSIVGPAIYRGDRNCGIEFRVIPITAVTELRIELGFVDVIPGSNKPIINSLVTPSVNTSVVDAAVFVYDHTGSTTTTELATKGTAITAAKAAIVMPTAVAAGTPFTVRLQLITNQVRCWVDGVNVANLRSGATDYIEGGSLVAPVALIRASNATSKSLKIDYVHIWQDRNGAV